MRVLIAARPWTSSEIEAARAFCSERSFDLVFHSGLDPATLSPYNELPVVTFGASAPPATRDALADEAQAVLAGRPSLYHAFFDLRPGEGAVVEVEGEKVAAYLDDDGTPYLLSARCQHMGCIVDWNSRARTWDCPCHGSRYQYDGALLNGPATRPLPPVAV